MTIPVNDIQLATGLEQLMGVAVDVKKQTLEIRTLASVDGMGRRQLVVYMARLSRAVTRINELGNVPGLAQYAKDQYNNPTLEIVTEFQTFRAACVQLRDWVYNNFPKHTSGAWLVSEFANDGTETMMTFTAAQLGQFVSHCDTLLALMD